MGKLEFGLFLDLATDEISIADHLAVYRPLVALAEEQGFGSVWAGESYAAASGGFQHISSPLLVLAALSGETKMRLGTGVTLLPMWDTLRLAYDCIVMDQLSGGRFELGVGLGAARTWQQFGVDAATIGERVDEQISALRALWAGEDGYHGQYIDIDGAIGPRPLQPAGPRIWVGGKIKRSTRRAAELGDGYIAGTHFGLGMVKRQIAGYRAALEAIGKGSETGRVAVNRILVLADDEEQAWSEAAPHLERLLRTLTQSAVPARACAWWALRRASLPTLGPTSRLASIRSSSGQHPAACPPRWPLAPSSSRVSTCCRA